MKMPPFDPRPTQHRTRSRAAAARGPLFLENGDRLTSIEFLRRYERMPGVKKAQLVEGTVFMPGKVRADHGHADGLLQFWLGTYALHQPRLVPYSSVTLLLDTDNAFEPDAILCSRPQVGGRVWLNDQGYLCGAPELVCEVATSSAAIDLHAKLRAYRRNGVAEYLVWVVPEKRARWFAGEEQEYVELKKTAGVLSSRAFPGLVLDVDALARADGGRLLSAISTHP